MENITIKRNSLEILLDCKIATPEEKRKRLEGVRSLPTSNVLFVGNTAYFIEEQVGDYIVVGQESPKPIAYRLGKEI